jgi:type VI secretion system protein ImpA
MGSPEVLDIEKLLAPIPGDSPAGVPLREDLSPTSVYYAIKDARTAARAAERSIVYEDDQTHTERPDWGPVLELGPKILAEKSKDLEVTAWLCEALIRKHGYAGLRDGFRLARGLVEGFWENLYPLPDEDGMITRVAPLAGLNGEDTDGVLITPIANVPVTAEGSYRPMTLSDYKQALDLERTEDPGKREQRMAQGASSLEMFETAVSETPAESFRDLLDDLDDCLKEFERLGAVLEEKCGKDEDGYPLAPPSSNIRNALRECLEHVRGFTKHLFPSEEEGLVEGEGSAMVPSAGGQGAAVAAQVGTREEAFRTLLKVAEFFKRTEPHSPVSYALEQAVRWGKMPLPELWAELVPDLSSREQLFKLVGIKPPEENE